MAAHHTPRWLTSLAADLANLITEHTLLVAGLDCLVIFINGFLLGRWLTISFSPVPCRAATKDASTQPTSPASTPSLIPHDSSTKDMGVQLTYSCQKTKAEACLRMAQDELYMRPYNYRGEGISPLDPQLENKDFLASKNKTEAIFGNFKRLDQNIHKVMDYGIYRDLRLDEISDVFETCLDRIVEQQDQHPRHYLPGAKPHKVVDLPEPSWIRTSNCPPC